jgi:hypothetical protein
VNEYFSSAYPKTAVAAAASFVSVCMYMYVPVCTYGCVGESQSEGGGLLERGFIFSIVELWPSTISATRGLKDLFFEFRGRERVSVVPAGCGVPISFKRGCGQRCGCEICGLNKYVCASQQVQTTHP